MRRSYYLHQRTSGIFYPHGGDDPFIFYSTLHDKPADPQIVAEGLKDALRKIGVDYKERVIVFHSWRHFFCSKITQIVDGEKVAKVSGHLSDSVFKKYADHIEEKNIKEVGDAAAQAFGSVLQLNKAGQSDLKPEKPSAVITEGFLIIW